MIETAPIIGSSTKSLCFPRKTPPLAKGGAGGYFETKYVV
jgi:hypothetical protein